jgi:Ca-activated chloride channel family protein
VRFSVLLAALFCVVGIAAQTPCLSAERIAALKAEIVNLKGPRPDDKLKTDILSIKADILKERTIPKKVQNPEATKQRVTERLCSMLNTGLWPTKSVVGPEVSSIWINLIRTYFPFPLQRELAQLIAAGVDKNEIDKDRELAAMIDRLRLSAGAAQTFGTQATEQNGFIVLYPLQSEDKVDAFRADYHLPPLRDDLRTLELNYRMPVIRSTARVARVAVERSETPLAGGSGTTSDSDEKEVTKIDTSLVTIDAVVRGPSTVKLEKGDFKIFEDGQEQEIDVFGAADSPSDIVLLLDLSGSTADKVGLIKKTTRQFVEMKRDVDRVSIVTFAGGQNIVSPLESEKVKLLDRVGKLKDSGESKVWDSIKYALDLLNRESSKDRRKAVVVMTDGVDNALAYEPGFGSSMLYSELLETVRNGSIAVFPIYLDTEGRDQVSARMYGDARKTLQLLGDDSGGVYYAAKDIENLNEVYEKVLTDLGRVYSLGYEPKNSTRDGSWRKIRVEVPSHPEIKIRARSGYYAK